MRRWPAPVRFNRPSEPRCHHRVQPSHHDNDQVGRGAPTITVLCSSSTSSSTQRPSSKAQRKVKLKIIQDQVGHAHASTTALYTGVSDEFRTRLLARALEAHSDELGMAPA